MVYGIHFRTQKKADMRTHGTSKRNCEFLVDKVVSAPRESGLEAKYESRLDGITSLPTSPCFLFLS